MQDPHSTLLFDAVHVRPLNVNSCGPGAGPATTQAPGRGSPDYSASMSKRTKIAFAVCGCVRQLALISIASMGLWPLILQVIMVPESVFGDGHGDRYEQMSYYAQENDHYQVLSPRVIDCEELQRHLFAGTSPVPTHDLVRAVPEALYKSLRGKVLQNTSADSWAARNMSVLNEIVGVGRDKSVCYGGVDSVGSLAIEALISRDVAPVFGLDPACIQDTATHLRMRLVPSEFLDPDTMSELNPVRIAGAVSIISVIDAQLKPVLSSCYETTRMTRFHASTGEYNRLVSVFSRRLLVADDCSAFTLFGGSHDSFGCAYSALAASGAIANINSDGANRSYSFPAPWRMIQCTVAGECSSLLFSQLWLSEWTVEKASPASGEYVLRYNFVNQKVYEVSVDHTFSVRLFISLQILAVVLTAYLTSLRGWHSIHLAVVSPWNHVVHATTACTIAKVVRSSYNLVLVAQMVLGLLSWRRQLTIDMLVGADTRQAVLRATGCGTLMAVLGVNIFFARAGDMKRQEIEPSFAHVIAFAASLLLYGATHIHEFELKARKLLLHGLRTMTPDEISQHSACRGSTVCAAQASLRDYSLLLVCVVVTACTIGTAAHTLLEASVRRKRSVTPHVSSVHRSSRPASLNSFNRFLDDRSRDTDLFDASVRVYVQAPDGTVLSTRGHLEVCGFVPTTTILLRYRDLPLLFTARALPVWILMKFNINVTIHDLREAGVAVDGTPIVHVADQVLLAHWSVLKKARLSWSDAYFGGRDFSPSHDDRSAVRTRHPNEFQRRCRCRDSAE